MSEKIALISGATSGIGYASALKLANSGYKIIACGRREERLLKLQNELEGLCEVKTLCFDIRDRKDVFSKVNSLEESWQNINLLLNNAGNAHGLSNFQEASLDDWEMMLDINVKGLLYLTKAVLPFMLKQDFAHIINIGSIAGKEVYPNGNVYCASKHAVDAINQGLRIDLVQENIKVSQIAPGLVETEFSLVRFKGDVEKSAKVYEGYEALKPEDIADLVQFIAGRPRHVNIADVLILPAAQATSSLLNKS